VLFITGGGPRVVSNPWVRHKLAGTRSTRVGREAYVSPEPGPVQDYLSVWPSRRVSWDVKRQLFVITDVDALGWREFVVDWAAWPDPASDEDELEIEKLLGHLPQHTDRGQRYFGNFAHLSYAYAWKRMRERQDFLELGSARYSDKIAEKNRQVGKRRIRATAGDNAARLKEIRRWIPALAGEDRIPLVPGFNFTH
jgi:hypothetical protein